MKERKNIDRIYQEGFKDFEASPREEVWKNIAAKLEEKQRKRPFVVPLWYKVGGIAATIAIILGLTYFLNTGPGTTPETQFVVEDEDIYRPEIEIPENNETIENASQLLNTIISGETRNSSNSGLVNNSGNTEKDRTNPSENEKENTPTEKYKADNWQNSALAQNASDEEDSSSEENRNSEAIANQNDASEAAENQFLVKTEEKTAENQFQKKNSEEIVENNTEEGVNEEENALAELAEEKNKPTVEIAEAEKGQIRFSTFAAPIFYDNMGSGNAISSNFSDNKTNSQVTMAYGVNVAYTLSDKVKIRTGVSKVNLSHGTEEISYTTTAFAQNISSIDYRSNLNVVEINDAPTTGLPNFDLANNGFGAVAGTGVNPGEINQQFGFIEVPVEIEYALIDKKFDLNIIGGGSSLFLDDNSVSLVSNNQRTELGEANNVNNVSFSTNIGVGLGYEIIPDFKLNLEPIFKYQLNTFKNTENVQPFFFGIYSGFSFKF